MTKEQPQHMKPQDQKEKQRPTEFESIVKSNQMPQRQQKPKSEVQTKKKIIKKFPFSSKTSANPNNDTKHEEDLKDWKPTSIGSSKIGSSNIKIDAPKKRNQIFNQFLSNLPKPQQKAINLQPINILGQIGSKKSHKQIYIKPTEQQLKWDAEDEFLTKNVQTYNKIQQKIQKKSQYSLQKIEQRVEDNQEMIENIVWLNEGKKEKEGNIAEIVSRTWQRQGSLLDGDEFDSDESQKKKKKPLSKSLAANSFKFK